MITKLINTIQPFVEQEILSFSSSYGKIVEINKLLKLHVIFFNKKKIIYTELLNYNDLQRAKNQQLIIIYEDELKNKFDIIVSRIKSLLGHTNRIHGRNTTIIKLTNPELKQFLKINHGNESFNARYKYGLKHKNELVAVASFGQIMHKKFEKGGKQSGELIRFCNKNGFTVVGGLSKLIKHFIKQHKVDDVMTYADKNWSDGKSYLKLGFNLVDEMPPVAFFVDTNTFERFNAKTKGLAKESLVSIWNTGSLKFILTVNN